MNTFNPITIILPTKNHEKSIYINIDKLYNFLENNFRDFQILILSNGSTKENISILSDKKFKNPKIDVVFLDQKGKGFAVRYGLINSRFDDVLIYDSDFSYNMELINEIYLDGQPISPFVTATRVVNKELFNTLSFVRYVAGLTFNLIVRKYLDINSKDTQAGFKLISKKEFTNCSQFISDDYLFDIELFILSEKINLNRKEIKVYSLNSPLGSNINLFSDSIKMLKNLIQIKKYYRVQS